MVELPYPLLLAQETAPTVIALGTTRITAYKKQKGNNTCGYCQRKVHCEIDCWTEQRAEQNDHDTRRDDSVNMLREIGLHETKGASEVVVAVYRSREGEPLPKQTNLRDEDCGRASMKIDILLNVEEKSKDGDTKRTEKSKKGGADAPVG